VEGGIAIRTDRVPIRTVAARAAVLEGADKGAATHHLPALSCVVSSDCEQRCEIVSAHNPEPSINAFVVALPDNSRSDSLSHVGARPRLERFFVKSFYCSELKNFSPASLCFYFMASLLH
jgi:hypothetical protein